MHPDGDLIKQILLFSPTQLFLLDHGEVTNSQRWHQKTRH